MSTQHYLIVNVLNLVFVAIMEKTDMSVEPAGQQQQNEHPDIYGLPNQTNAPVILAFNVWIIVVGECSHICILIEPYEEGWPDLIGWVDATASVRKDIQPTCLYLFCYNIIQVFN